jgi:NAD-dependent SIR2 family protein deacetylase
VRVLILTGAGVSAESGIPTFRGKDGYWRNIDPARLATPEAFERNPKLVWEWYRERRQRIWNAQPNAAHAAIATLAQHADIIDWALRASRGGELIEVNPEETPLSRFATQLVREPAAVALPQIVDALARCP